MGGLTILLAAVGMAVLRSPSATGDQVVPPANTTTRPAGPTVADAGVVMPMLIALGIALVVTMLVAAYALFRLTRRLAVPEAAARKPEPTATNDVWAMHRPPEEPADDSEPGDE